MISLERLARAGWPGALLRCFFFLFRWLSSVLFFHQRGRMSGFSSSLLPGPRGAQYERNGKSVSNRKTLTDEG